MRDSCCFHPLATLVRWIRGTGAMGAHGLGKIAVPFFFLASGYFLAGHLDEDGWYGRKVKKRVFSLVIPLLLW